MQCVLPISPVSIECPQVLGVSKAIDTLLHTCKQITVPYGDNIESMKVDTEKLASVLLRY